MSSRMDWELARAVVGSRAPVLTAIGHREDETLADLVADARAHTPSLVGSVLARNRAIAREAAPGQAASVEPGRPAAAEAPPVVGPRRQPDWTWIVILLAVIAIAVIVLLIRTFVG